MSIEGAFTAYLLSKVGLTALIGTRFYPERIPQGTALPTVAYITIDDIPDHFLSGMSTLRSPIFQFSVYAATKASARAVSEQIQAILNDFTGTLSGVKIQHIKLMNVMPTAETSADGTLTTYIESLEYEITYERT